MKLRDIFSPAAGVVAAQTAIVGGLVSTFGRHSVGASAVIGLGSVAAGIAGTAVSLVAGQSLMRLPGLERLNHTPAGTLIGLALVGGGYVA